MFYNYFYMNVSGPLFGTASVLTLANLIQNNTVFKICNALFSISTSKSKMHLIVTEKVR